MSVLQREELEESPLADLHAIASELGLEGFRSMRRDELVGAILRAQGEDDRDEREPDEVPADEALDAPPAATVVEPAPEAEPEEAEEPPPERIVSGVLDILPNGSGFVRMEVAAHSLDDVYVSSAQIRRCELRAGDEISGPVRPARRHERHPSLIHVESVNGADPEPPEQRPHFGDLTAVFPSERLAAPPALEGVPYGKGSRVAVSGPPGAGGTTLLREIVQVLGERHPELRVQVVLAGVRPEEVAEWGGEVAGGSFDRSPEAQAQAAELAVERAKRRVERGEHAAIAIDSLDPLPPGARRRVFGAARATAEGGSLTVFAVTGEASEALRWATTRIVLEPAGPDSRGPSVAGARSGSLRADQLR